jgi:hypothetical protein
MKFHVGHVPGSAPALSLPFHGVPLLLCTHVLLVHNLFLVVRTCLVYWSLLSLACHDLLL